MKAEVFKRAWNLFNNNYGTFSECLKQSWKAVKIKVRMLEEIVSFKFVKKDGTIREAHGTLTKQISKGTGKQAPLSILAYYDVEKESVRSFKVESLV